MSDEDLVVGIDLGTTNSAIGVVDSGMPLLLADEEGRRLLPSAVSYAGGEPTAVGHDALRRSSLGRECLVTSAKRLMGVAGAAGKISVGEGRSVSAEDVAGEILKKLKALAESRLECPVTRAVITVPAYFNDAQRSATRRAGEAAGFVVERLVAEPTAAALAYGLSRLQESSRVAVYDLGGGTFDVSVLELREGVFEVLATAGDTALGGDDFDTVLQRMILAEASLDPQAMSPEQLLRLRQESLRVKHLLSEQEEVPYELPFFSEEGHLSGVVCRGDFEQRIAPYLEKTVSLCRRVLADAGLVAGDLNEVVLVGGSTRVPVVRKQVEDVFGRKPDLSQHPDEAVALGAAIQAGVLSGAYQQVLLLDVTPLSLGIETVGGLMNVLIPRNTTIPCKAGEMFTNAQAGQTAMRVRVLQGERELAADNWELGRFEVAFEEAQRGQARVGVQFAIDADGILEVLARDTKTGEDTVVEIKSAAVDVTDDQVEKMVSESVDHAFEDMSARIFTEARLKAEELLSVLDEALKEGGGYLDPEDLAEVEGSRRAVEDALANKEANALKAAVEALDRATENLAAVLVEEAMRKHMEAKLDSPAE